MYKTLYLLIFSLLAQVSIAQDLTILKEHFSQLSQEKSSRISKEDLNKYYQESDAIVFLKSYLTPNNEKVKKEAIRLTTRIGANNVYPFTRQISGERRYEA